MGYFVLTVVYTWQDIKYNTIYTYILTKDPLFCYFYGAGRISVRLISRSKSGRLIFPVSLGTGTVKKNRDLCLAPPRRRLAQRALSAAAPRGIGIEVTGGMTCRPICVQYLLRSQVFWYEQKLSKIRSKTLPLQHQVRGADAARGERETLSREARIEQSRPCSFLSSRPQWRQWS
jgi:hypothetical protein